MPVWIYIKTGKCLDPNQPTSDGRGIASEVRFVSTICRSRQADYLETMAVSAQPFRLAPWRLKRPLARDSNASRVTGWG